MLDRRSQEFNLSVFKKLVSIQDLSFSETDFFSGDQRFENLAALMHAVFISLCLETSLRLLGPKGNKYCIGNPVAEFIQVTLGNVLRGKYGFRSCHETCSS